MTLPPALTLYRATWTLGEDVRRPPTGTARHRSRGARTVPRVLRGQAGQTSAAQGHRANPAGPPGRVSPTPGMRMVAAVAPQVAIVMIVRGVGHAMVRRGHRTAGRARRGGRVPETNLRMVGAPIAAAVDRARNGGRIREIPGDEVRTCAAPRPAVAPPPDRLPTGRAATAVVAAHPRVGRRMVRSVHGSRGRRPRAIPPAGPVAPPGMAAVPSVGPLTGRTAGRRPATDAATTGPAADRMMPRRLRVHTTPAICAAPTGPTGSVRPRSTRTSRVMSSIVSPAPRYGTSRSGVRSGSPSTS